MLRVTVAALFDENVGQSNDEIGARGGIFALLIEDVEQGAARVRLGFRHSSLPCLHARGRQQRGLRRLFDLFGRRRGFESRQGFQRCAAKRLGTAIASFRVGIAALTFEHDGAHAVGVGFK